MSTKCCGHFCLRWQNVLVDISTVAERTIGSRRTRNPLMETALPLSCNTKLYFQSGNNIRMKLITSSLSLFFSSKHGMLLLYPQHVISYLPPASVVSTLVSTTTYRKVIVSICLCSFFADDWLSGAQGSLLAAELSTI